MFSTLFVSNLEISKLYKLLQLSNIFDISLTLFVTKLLTSIYSNFLQPENILDISSTFFVLNEVIFKEVNEEQ